MNIGFTGYSSEVMPLLDVPQPQPWLSHPLIFKKNKKTVI